MKNKFEVDREKGMGAAIRYLTRKKDERDARAQTVNMIKEGAGFAVLFCGLLFTLMAL
jgi:hypothetical protein